MDKAQKKRSRWKSLFHLLVFLAIFVNVRGEECEFKLIRPESQEAEVICHIPTLTSLRTNFTLQIEFVTSLTVVCSRDQPSQLENSTLGQLSWLKTLKLVHCGVANVTAEAFHALSELRELTLLTNNETQLDIEILEHKQLEILNLAHNNINTLSLTAFCGLPSLKVLNLTYNFLEEFILEGCLKELLKLDLSFNNLVRLQPLLLPNLRLLNLQHNRLEFLSQDAITSLKKLQRVYFNNNELSSIPEDFFGGSTDIKEIHLQNNSLEALLNCFGGLQQLLVLNVSFNLLRNEHLSSDTFSDLIRLVVLDLSYNRLQRINISIFQSQYSLQKLLLDHNQIEWISDNTFSALYNLHTLMLGGNRLKVLESFTLNGLYVLAILNLQDNFLEVIQQDSFRNCSSIQELFLSGNKFQSIPSAISSLQFLRRLDLSDNVINEINNSSLQNLKHLHTLQLNRNDIGNLTRGIFKDTPFLKRIELSENRIQNLAHGIFDEAIDVEVIELNDNLLTDINGLFMNLHNLELLNVSRNKITWFDYALVPHHLKSLDLHDNELDILGNYFELESDMTTEILDVSYNLLKEIRASSFPHSVQMLNLNHNQITNINPFTFMLKTNLTRIDLTYNLIRNLDMNSLRLQTVDIPPQIFIAGNPFYCDCTMEWLQRINNLDTSRQYPKIVDLDSVMCEFPFTRHHKSLPLSKANTSNFLCNYKSHCFALCHCCEFDACDCEMVCPENCTCYADQTWNTNAVDCSGGNYTSIPLRIPMDVTALYLDGNDISQLTSHTFIGRKNMRVIYLNNSQILTINNRTFNGLTSLRTLYLNHNRLSILHGFEFETLYHLRELYLDHNEIVTVTNVTFIPLKSLEVLHLHHNRIAEYQVWMLSLNRHLSDVRLGNNPWSCGCRYVEDFYDWLQSTKQVQDVESVRCSSNQTHGLLIRSFNSSTLCNNRSSITYFQAVFIEDYIPVMITAPSVLLLVVFVLVIACIYRKDVKVWLFTKYGIRLFHRNNYTPENEKLFDAFVSYCKKDEAFIAQILAPELECGNPPYRLCLRYRDLPSAGYVAEAISEAIECSHRTIVVLSEQFLKSEWCRFELKTAHRESQRNPKHRLVVALLDRVSFKEMDPDAKMCFHSSPVIRWGDKRFWEKLRYSLPDGKVTEPKNHQFSPPSNSVKLV
ncbi:toll-like receptor Tollo [Centruroides sculpturatus]|uniref:toll-like receptor Tollo n=1 Tax=Centruroides sculpturatus TaxID=218467 RepID=UPI000C6E5676|nr:toll-like receptor Tollo [Centruroides sculpturatus]